MIINYDYKAAEGKERKLSWIQQKQNSTEPMLFVSFEKLIKKLKLTPFHF